MQRLQLKHLLSALSPNQPQQQSRPVSNTDNVTNQFLGTTSLQVKPLPLRQQLKIKRETTYRNTQQEMDKWVGIVKLNRQKDTLNLIKKDKDNGASVSFFPATPISEFHNKIQSQLKQMEIPSQQAVMRKEDEALMKVSKEEAKQRVKQARKQRTAQFNEQVKRRRIAKIKSKLYHKIKKRQKLREEGRRIGEMKGQQKKEYMQKLAKQRIHERITLRHKSKNKHIQNLLRFSKGNKQSIQDSINQVNAIRQQQLQKLNEEGRDNMSEDLEDSNYHQQLEDLQQEIDQMEGSSGAPKGLDSMKFMQIGLQKELKQHKQQTNTLAKMIQCQEDIVDQSCQQENQKEITRKTFGENTLKNKAIPSTNSNFIQRNLKKALGGEEELTQGISVSRLKEKYQPQRSQVNLTQAIKIHKEAFNGVQQVIQDNYRQFEKEKHMQYQAELAPQQKKLKGWGTWAGPGISEPKIDQAAEIRKKLAKIQEIKKKRRDGEMAGVIVRENYNKNLKDYMVNKLPHNLNSGEQFDYLQSQPIGHEWNSLTQFQANIRPKVLTKAGEVIEPIKMPKYIEKRRK